MSSYLWKTQNEVDQQKLSEEVSPALENTNHLDSAQGQHQPVSNSIPTLKKRRKIKKAKEEKEDGELDDENEEVNTSPEDYEDYDDYDFDSDSKNSQASTYKLEPQIKTTAADTPYPALVETVVKPPPSSLLEQSDNRSEAPIIPPPVEQSFSITNPYDIEYEDYDSDDDDYGNNKRLKIDEQDDVIEQPTLVATSEDKNNTNNEDITKTGMTIDDHSIAFETEAKNTEISSTSSLKDNPLSQDEFQKIESKQETSETSCATTNLYNDNEASSSSVSSSKSVASSVMTAMSQVSSDSLPFSGDSTVPLGKEEPKSDKQETQEDIPKDKGIPVSADEVNSDTNEDLMKVPALKIIFSNSNGSLPYVKTTPKDQQKSTGQTKTAVKKESNQEILTITTPIKQQPPDSAGNGSPGSSLRSKLPRSVAARVASPITTSTTTAATVASVTTSFKTTPTRRSAAAAALNITGRASPSAGGKQEVKKVVEEKQHTSGGIGDDSSNSNSSISGSTGQNQTGDSSEGVGTRRKLRSHTRLGGSEELTEPIISSLKSKSTNVGLETSSSPVTFIGETSTNQATEETTDSGVKTNQAIVEGCELSNSSIVETAVAEANGSSSTTAVSNVGSGINLNDFMPTRKKRNRQQQQQLQEQLDLINEIDSLNASIAASLNQPSTESSEKSDLAINSSHISHPSEPGAETDQSEQTSINPSLFNCIKKFVDLRQDVTKRREALIQSKIDVRLPKNFNEFIISRKSYLIKGNKEAQKAVPFFKPPNDIPDDLRLFFSKQEKERYSLRLRHRVEQDKLIILYEQEVLRCFNKAARAVANQEIPFSFCSMIKDDEIYSMFRISEQASLSATTAPPILNNENEPGNCGGSGDGSGAGETVGDTDGETGAGMETSKQQVTSVPEVLSPEEVFSNNLNDLRMKFQKLKDDCIKRQLNESDSLHAVQKMDFQAKLRELSNKYKNAMTTTSSTNSAHILSPNKNLSAFNIISHFKQNDLHVPIVHVNNKFDLLDATQQQFISTDSSNSANSVAIYA